MKLLLALLLLTFLLSIRTARRGRNSRIWPLLIAVLAVSVAFLNYRVI